MSVYRYSSSECTDAIFEEPSASADDEGSWLPGRYPSLNAAADRLRRSLGVLVSRRDSYARQWAECFVSVFFSKTRSMICTSLIYFRRYCCDVIIVTLQIKTATAGVCWLSATWCFVPTSSSPTPLFPLWSLRFQRSLLRRAASLCLSTSRCWKRKARGRVLSQKNWRMKWSSRYVFCWWTHTNSFVLF